MKKLLVLFFFSSVSFAQDYAFKINPVSLAFSGIEISYESKSRSEAKSSVEVVAAIIDYKINSNDQVSGWAAEFRYKFLLDGEIKGIEGGYIAPVFTFTRAQFNKHDIAIYALGAIGGYQYVFQNKNKKGFVLDLFGGFGYNKVNSYQLNTEKIVGFKPRIGVSLGYAF